jgi:hypothetical protein
LVSQRFAAKGGNMGIAVFFIGLLMLLFITALTMIFGLGGLAFGIGLAVVLLVSIQVGL